MSRKILFIFLFVVVGLTTPIVAQVVGGRQKEHKNQRGGGLKSIFKRTKSKGNADSFAGKKRGQGFFSKLFQRNQGHSQGPWVYKPTKMDVKQKKEQEHLFKRARTKNKVYREGLLAKQNNSRSSGRNRGVFSFQKKKR